MLRYLLIPLMMCARCAFGQIDNPNSLQSQVGSIQLDSAERQRVIDGVISQLKDSYVDLGIAEKMGEALITHLKKGEYDSLSEGDLFAARLTSDLRDVSHDKHLNVRYSSSGLAPVHGDPTPEERSRSRAFMERFNCGFEKAEISFDNIAYVKVNFFGPPDVCSPTVTAAMGFIAHVNALIFDLRDNNGGDPAMVSFLASFLFDKRTHLIDLYNRQKNQTTEYWTNPDLPGTRFSQQPVFVLMSSRTFSGGEEFCYDLQTQKRATLVGEVTAGGAHPAREHRLDDHFSINVPYAQAVNLITKTDWEGTGVKPDVAVAADFALETARKLAFEALQKGNLER